MKLKQTEAQLQKACMEYMQYKNIPFIRNNTFAGTVMFGKKNTGYIHNNSFPGSPDILVFLPNGRTLHIELKSATGKQSTEQKHYEEVLSKLGHEYHLVRELEELEQHINNPIK